MITWRGMGRGARELVAVGAYAFVFGVAFGIAARNVGMEGWAANLMSAAVFAGGSQFAVLELWQSPVAWGPLLIATLAVNGRHFLLGASLYPWLRSLPAWQVYLAAVLLSEPNWAKAIEAEARGERDVGNYWVDVLRATLRFFLPLALLWSVLLASQGVPATLAEGPTYAPLDQSVEMRSQHVPLGPVAPMVAVKQLGTNGGG
ncbi:MAG: AzlC family ABC transporter permease, partial [Geminicoccaceae bacterium]|nr:AzlC family ABC transporter permease [Geminicoccaceae bacterium]